ncbi:hypothetical protein [Mesorhizobium sp.]|uniref:hypothetical protein n=1 Tax=Mesorhizobium sp. TaxID=1871066 RepID=UPI0025BD685C|nr:hypothetical protein [Mesorhizobium sp.]
MIAAVWIGSMPGSTLAAESASTSAAGAWPAEMSAMRYAAAGCQGCGRPSETPPRLAGATTFCRAGSRPEFALADDGFAKPARPTASKKTLIPVIPGAAFCIFITPTFDCGRYQSCLKLSERKVGKFRRITIFYFSSNFIHIYTFIYQTESARRSRSRIP